MDNRLIALYDKGKTVFGSAEEFNLWLNDPEIGIGAQVLSSLLLDTTTGVELVMQELIRIEFGDLA